MRRAGIVRTALLVAVAIMAAACAAPSPPPPPAPPPVPAVAPAPRAVVTPPPAPLPPPSCVEATAAAMSLEAKAGQLLVVGVPVAGETVAEFAALQDYRPGGVLLFGRSSAGADEIGAVTDELQRAGAAASPGNRLLVTVDQEGGQVQVLSGPGFSEIPPAAVQGQWSPAELRDQATRWGTELRAAGVHVVLAPVADVLSAELGDANAPVGRTERAFGTEPGPVADSVVAFVEGMRAAGIATTVKHFPGLGRVRGNTDYASGVTDTETTPDDPAFAPFQAGVATGAPLLMVSSATYSQIDPDRRAVFSPAVLQGLIRDTLAFPGVIISDDLGNADEIAAIPPAERAVDFVAAGGDAVLTAAPESVGLMIDALVAAAGSDPAFAARIEQSVRRVLAAKEAAGLLSCG